jgi:hypothetical protein
MKNYVKFAVVGLAGYFIGFYECKYKAMKAYIELTNKDDNSKERNCKEDSNKETKE